MSEAKREPPIQAREDRTNGVDEGISWRNDDDDDDDDDALLALAAVQIAIGNPVIQCYKVWYECVQSGDILRL